MKKYKEYMDGIRASDTLHQRLLELEAPAKRPVPWKRYRSMAAALILVCGLGAWGLSRLDAWGGVSAQYAALVEHMESSAMEADQPDIAPAEPGDLDGPGEKTLGGYEVRGAEDGPDTVVSYYMLPYIEYGESDGTEAASPAMADWDIPAGATRRDLTQDEIIALMGGEDAVNTHLDWNEYQLFGWGAWYEDGSFWGAYINGGKMYYGLGVANTFEFAVTAGQLPPTCFVYPYSVTQEIRGLTVTADRYRTPTAMSVPYGADAPEITHLTVRFMKDSYGYCFQMGSLDSEAAEELVSRLVRQVADQGLALWTVDPSVKTYTCSVCGQTLPVNGRIHAHSFVDLGDSASTEPYDPLASGELCGLPLNPNEAADPAYNSPRDRGEDWCGTPNADPNDAMCSGYPVPDPAEITSTNAASIIPAKYQSSPPTLRVRCSEGLADGRSGNYEWTYTDLLRGKSSVVACGVHPLEFRDAPSLTTADGTVVLNFFDLPDRVRVDCWPDSEWGSTSAGRQTADAVREGQTYALTLKEGGWIYEINAEWDDQGRAAYVFYLVKN